MRDYYYYGRDKGYLIYSLSNKSLMDKILIWDPSGWEYSSWDETLYPVDNNKTPFTLWKYKSLRNSTLYIFYSTLAAILKYFSIFRQF